MKINSVKNINYNYSQNRITRISKPISFGEEHWDGDPTKYDRINERMKNERINNFVNQANEFRKSSKQTVRYLKKMAQKIYTQSEESGFKAKEGSIDLEGDTYRMSCNKRDGRKIAVLKHCGDKIICLYKNNEKRKPQEYSIELGHIRNYESEYYKLEVTPDKTTLTYKDKESSEVEIITFDKNSSTYQKKDGINSSSYESVIRRNFPHSFKVQYIENIGLRNEDIRYTYTFNHIKRNWGGSVECIKRGEE